MIAVFDIGKTNKKCFIFNEDYRIVFEKTNQLTEIMDEEGEVCEDLDLLKNWVLDTLREILNDPHFPIRAINVTTYGASLVHLDRDGQPLTPLYNYLRAFPDELKKRFFDRYSDESKIALETASPVLGNLNSGLQLYWLKQQKPLIFNQIHCSLHLPQFVAYFIAKNLANGVGLDNLYSDQESVSFRTEGEESEGVARNNNTLFGLRPQIPRYALNDNAMEVSEITSIGCHTLLWDFQKNDYHDWVKAEGLTEKFPPIQPSNVALPITNNQYANNQTQVGIGLHDSSAALIPYLAYFDEPFLLISTGTWCISLNPFNDEPLTADELSQDCLCYLSYAGKPVKAARYFGGHEHEQGVKKLAAQFGVGEAFYRSADLADHAELAESYRQLIVQLVEHQAHSTRLALGNSPVRRIFVDGGFSKNELYLALLAEAFPGMEVFSAEVAQATALGAALAIHACWNEKSLPPNLISLKKY